MAARIQRPHPPVGTVSVGLVGETTWKVKLVAPIRISSPSDQPHGIVIPSSADGSAILAAIGEGDADIVLLDGLIDRR
jgi:hypothetical protein